MTTFADILQAQPSAHDGLRRAIVESQKFQITADLLGLVEGLGAEAIQDGAQFCRLPFPTTWLEWVSPKAKAGRLFVGALCYESGGTDGRVFDMWALSGWEKPPRIPGAPPQFAGVNPYWVRVDLRDPGVIHFDLSPGPSHPKIRALSAEYVSEWADPEHGDETSQRTLLGVAHVVVGTLMFLCAKGGADVETVRHDEALQRSRVKAGKLPLVSFSRLKIDLGKPAREPVAGSGSGAHTPKRGHVVRGHFKRIPCGLRWWKPHIRGDLGRGFVVKRYELTGTPEARP